ncbi:Putative mitochondrial carrier protein PET8 [Seminavis robusta]|uniref:Mitochondrial carrier protein PET8 n=1 Tax=Seminavis robusta TaxID=568900 RepID=A0A9N8HD26_9STRA|nr:Putative mitochondrial carrier protein PET8 [Seminavis robusta]|eukprot:Sro342_g121770.1 Putative mitochondrial carrier protein PET8 (520) ;mRNA; r:44985-46544
MSLSLAVLLLLTPLTANADFGPSSAATTQPIPGLTRPQIQGKDIGGKKLKQLIGSTIDETRLEQFGAQLDDVIEALKQRKATASDDYFYTSMDEEELLNAEQLQAQIVSREKLLDKLEAQPYWFNYLAAFIGSVASTLVMHPVDTIKTRLQIANNGGADKDDEDDDEEWEVMASNTPNNNGYPHAKDGLVPLVSSASSATLVERVTERSSSSTSSITYNMSDLQPEEQVALLDAAPVAVLTKEEELEHDNVVEPQLHLDSSDAALVRDAVTKQAVKDDDDFFTLFASLYVGLTGNLLKEGPPSALYLGVYESVKYSLLPRTSPELLLLVYLVAGAAGETVGSVVRAPAEAVKSLVQSESADSAMAAVEQIMGSSEGRANVVRAWSASIWRDVPFGAIQLAIFELVKAYILNNPNIDFDSSTLSSEAIIGAFAGGCGAFLTNPADVITTRIITQSTDEEDEDNKPLGFSEMGRLIYEEGGVGAFFTGWQARVGYWAPAISIFLTCYCSVRQAGVRYELFG